MSRGNVMGSQQKTKANNKSVEKTASKQKSVLEFKDVLDNTDNEKDPIQIAITMHDVPDLDSMAAAFGIQRILNDIDENIKSVIVYRGEVSHPQNKTMLNLLDIPMTHYNAVADEKFDHYICVDCTPERTAFKDQSFLLVVDHHKAETKNGRIVDIRSVGSASSIIWEYMQELNIILDPNDEFDQAIATAMNVGIQVDTNKFVSETTSDLDFEAYKDLLKRINRRHMSSIINYPIPPYYFELRKKLDLSNNICIENGIFIGGVGYITPGKRDILPMIAEERARAEGIDTAFVYAIVGDHIETVVRSSGLSIDVSGLCKNIFGSEYAGGKTGAGAAKIPMGWLAVQNEGADKQAEMWEAVKSLISSRILAEMSNHR